MQGQKELTLKIDNSVKSLTGSDASRPAGETRQGKSAAATTTPGGESVSLSPLSAQLQAGLVSSEAASPARVAEIKQAIAEGRFRVNPEAVADRLLETVRELIRAHKP